MTEERDPTEAEMVALFAMLLVTRDAILQDLRSCVWRLWATRAIVLMNVTMCAYNGAKVESGGMPWVSGAGAALCAWGAWHALKSERVWVQLIERGRAHVREMDNKIKSVERVRHES